MQDAWLDPYRELYPSLPTRWVAYSTEQFLFRYPASAPLDLKVRESAKEIEHLVGVLTETLQLRRLPAEPLEVVLTASEEDEPPAESATGARCLQVVCRADTPVVDIARAVVQRLLVEAWGANAARADLVVDGLLGIASELARTGSLAKLNASLHAERERGVRVGLAELFAGVAVLPRPHYARLATSFLGYLVTAYGPARVADLARAFDRASPGRSFEIAFGKPPAALEQEWLASLRASRLRVLGSDGMLARLLPLVRAHAGLVAVLLLAVLLGVVYSLSEPFLIKALVEEVALARSADPAPRSGGGVAVVLLLLTVAAAIQGVGRLLTARTGALLGAAVAGDLRLRLFERIQAMALDPFDRSRAAEALTRLSTEVDFVETVLRRSVPVLISALLTLVLALLLIAVFINWRVSLIAALVVAGLALLARRFGRLVTAANARRAEAKTALTAVLDESILTAVVATVFGLNAQRRQTMRRALETVAASARQVALVTGAQRAVGMLALVVLYLAALGGGALALSGALTEGLAIIALVLLFRPMAQALGQLATVSDPLQRVTGALAQIGDVLNQPVERGEEEGAHPLPLLEREIRFDNVSFSYLAGQPVLDRIDLVIPAGTTFAIVGLSGAGKSTIVRLLSRLVDPTIGSVRFDDYDLRMVSRASLYAQMGIVFQQPVLFDRSIRENIQVGKPDASDAEIEAALRAVDLFDLVSSLPQGIETRIGAGGVHLSLGQRQRLALARALVRQPRLLVLDEATAALDPEAEAALFELLRKTADGRTVVFLTQRVATARHADQIAVLSRGRIVQQGTHDELVAEEGLYRRLWQAQSETLAEGRVADPALIAARLKAIPLFRDFDEAGLAALAARLATEELNANEIVFAQGDPADKLYLILSGQVEVTTVGPAGEERLFAVLNEGDHFGEMALRRESPRTTTARTRTPTVLLSLDRRQILKSIADVLAIPDAHRSLIRWLLRRESASLAEIVQQLNVGIDEALRTVESLIQRGFLTEVEVDGQVRYRARLAPRRGRHLPAGIWRALDREEN
ncbi:MAG: ATP-binding cassette domain-containing protein [Chloroflexota bacterium]|nr:ATP-binding cassette domain-containing protein [Dehalococcoidia bacterium]MDW8254573.1 ATP-binding cassette domain-containing protein [Chloroflexota bacterium]